MMMMMSGEVEKSIADKDNIFLPQINHCCKVRQHEKHADSLRLHEFTWSLYPCSRASRICYPEFPSIKYPRTFQRPTN
jgi:hypothetical protein